MDGADLPRLSASLTSAMALGRPGEAIFAAWASLNDEDPAWRALLEAVTAAAGRLHPSVGASASIHPDAVAVAVADRRG